MEIEYEYLMLSEFIDKLIKVKDEYGDCFMTALVNDRTHCQIAIKVENNQDCTIVLK